MPGEVGNKVIFLPCLPALYDPSIQRKTGPGKKPPRQALFLWNGARKGAKRIPEGKNRLEDQNSADESMNPLGPALETEKSIRQ